MALGSPQPLVKMSTRNIPGSKGGRCVRLTFYHHIVPLSRNLGALTSLDPSGPARPVTGVLCFTEAVCFLATLVTTVISYGVMKSNTSSTRKGAQSRDATPFGTYQISRRHNPQAVTLNHRRRDSRELQFLSEVIWRVFAEWCNFMPHCSLSVILTLRKLLLKCA